MKNVLAIGFMTLLSLPAFALRAGDVLACVESGDAKASSRIEISSVSGQEVQFSYFARIDSGEGWQVALDTRTGSIRNQDLAVASGQEKNVGQGSVSAGALVIDRIGYDLNPKVCVRN